MGNLSCVSILHIVVLALKTTDYFGLVVACKDPTQRTRVQSLVLLFFIIFYGCLGFAYSYGQELYWC